MKTIHPQETRCESDSAALFAWRLEQLVSSGFDAELAQQLARRRGIDLHALIELVERGCPPPLAARIHVPLEDGAFAGGMARGGDADAEIPGLRAHLDGCPACREEHESLRALVGGER